MIAARAAAAMARGVERAGHAAHICPVGDGGEGTMDAVLHAVKGEVFTARVAGPLGDLVDARWAMLADGTAIVELAEASGLQRVPCGALDPMKATTFGTGELIRRAIARGCREVVVFAGGSATIDGGAGAAQALGVRLFDDSGRDVAPPAGGVDLGVIARVAPPEALPCRLRIACDVRNPLLGAHGAAAVYGPQKGATPQQVVRLEECLRQWAEVVGGDADQPGAGAAGGVGFGLAALFGATLEPGADLVLRLIRFEGRLKGIDLVMTGEGCLDAQTLEGKAVMAVAQAAQRAGVPAIAIVGREEPGVSRCIASGGLLTTTFSMMTEFGERSLAEPEWCLETAAMRVMANWAAA